MVSMAITTFIVASAYKIFTEGLAFFRVNQAAADAQTAITKTMTLIASELANAAPMVTQPYPEGGASLPGIAFATPLQDGGAVRYDPVNGDIFWQRYICFYFEQDPEAPSGGTNGKIWRVTEDVDSSTEPLGPPGHRDTSYIASVLLATTTNNFQTMAGAKRRLVADGIAGFNVELYDGTEFGIVTGAEERAFDITVEAGDKNNRTRDSYYLKVKSRVVPRG